MLSTERKKKAAERGRRYRQRKKALKAAEQAAIGKGETSAFPPRLQDSRPSHSELDHGLMTLAKERRKKAAERERGYRQRRKALEAAEEAAVARGEAFERPARGRLPKASLFKPGSRQATASAERKKKAAERQRGYRRVRKGREAAQEEAIANGETFELPPRGQHLQAYHYKAGHEPVHKGVRARLSKDFILAFHQHFLAKGYSVFDELLANDPATYARLLTSLVAKQVEVHADISSGFSDEYVLKLIEGLDRWLAAQSDPGESALVLSAVSEAEIVP